MALASLGEEVHCVGSGWSQQSPHQGLLWSTSVLVVGHEVTKLPSLSPPSYAGSLLEVTSRNVFWTFTHFYPQNDPVRSGSNLVFYLVEEETISRTVNLELRLKQSKIKIKTLWEKKEVKTIQKLNCHGCWGQSVAYQMFT